MRRLLGHRWSVRTLAYLPGPEPLLLSGGDDGTLKLWDPVTGELQADVWAHTQAVEALALSHEVPPRRLVSGGRDGSLILWELPELVRCELCPSQRAGPVVGLGFHPDGGILAAFRSVRYGMTDSRLLRWDPGLGVQGLPWEGTVEAAAFTPDGRTWAVADLARTVSLIRPDRLPVFVACPTRIRCLAFAPAGAGPLLAVGAGRMGELWDIEEGKNILSWEAHRAEVLSLAFGPAGQLLTGGGDRSVRLWEAASGRPAGAWDWKIGRVHAVALSPDGMTAAAGGEKSDVVVWDLDP